MICCGGYTILYSKDLGRNIMFRASLGWLVLGCAVALFGCDSGRIQNFEGIEVDSVSRLGRLDIRIYLTNDRGNRLLWDPSVLTPQIGVSAISESESSRRMSGFTRFAAECRGLRFMTDGSSIYAGLAMRGVRIGCCAVRCRIRSSRRMTNGTRTTGI